MSNSSNTIERAMAKKEKGVTCTICGKEGYSTSYTDCEEKRVMDEINVCFKCALWTIRSNRNNNLIIDGGLYSIGRDGDGGMAGRVFRIKLNNGEIKQANSLWHGGDIPEHFLGKMPNTAEFIDGAYAAKDSSGKTYRFNPSNSASIDRSK